MSSPTGDDALVRDATEADAADIAELIRAAFASHAALYNDASLPPLRESDETVLQAMRAGIVLVAEESGRIVGTIKGTERDGVVEVGRLAVAPDARRRGTARVLARALEARYPQATRFDLFTGHLSREALGLYESLGYRRTRTQREHEHLTLVYLSKPGGRDGDAL